MRQKLSRAIKQERLLDCPKCHSILKIGFKYDVEIEYCPKCNGIWVEHTDERKILNISSEVFSIDELKRLRKLYAPLERPQHSGYVPCPVCSNLMNRRNWGSHSGVIVDRCEAHGTWYDVNEIEKIREFIALGGIEYEKLKRLENSLSEIEKKFWKFSQNPAGRQKNK